MNNIQISSNMKMSIAILFFVMFHLMSTKLNAQVVPCIKMIEEAINEKDYRMAILKLNAAKRCNPTLENMADSLTLIIFDKINSLNNNLEIAKTQAIDALVKAKKSDSISRIAKEEAESNLKKAQIQKVRADSSLIIVKDNQKRLMGFIQNFFSFIDDNKQSDDYIEWMVENNISDDFRSNIVFLINKSSIEDKNYFINYVYESESTRDIAKIFDVLGRRVARNFPIEIEKADTNININKEIFGDFENFEVSVLLNRKAVFNDLILVYPKNSYCKYAAGIYYSTDSTQADLTKSYFYLIDYHRLSTRLKIMGDNYKKAEFDSLASRAHESAIEVSKDAGFLYPDIYEYRNLLAMTFYALEDYESAKNEFIILQKDFPEEEIVNKYLGSCYRLLNKDEKAIEVLQSYLKVKDNDEWAMKNLMYSYSSLSRYEEAYDISQRLIKMNPSDYNYYWNKSYYCLFINKSQEAILAAKKSLDINDKETGVIRNLVLGYVLNDQFEEAEKIYNEWKDRPYPGKSYTFGERFLADIYNFIGKGIKHEDYEKVKILLIKYDDRELVAKQKMYLYSDQSKYLEAYKLSNRLIEMDSGDYNYYYSKSYYCLFINKPQEAISAAKKSLELNPDKTGVYTNLALGYVLNNEYEKAEQIYLKWKDQPLPDDDRLFKEAFLNDIEALEQAGITHKSFKKVKKLLK